MVAARPNGFIALCIPTRAVKAPVGPNWVHEIKHDGYRLIRKGLRPSNPRHTARRIGQQLSERLGQPFVIENRPGAGSNIGTEAVVNAPPDGYTLLLINPANAINATLYEKLNFNFIRDIAPVGGLSRESNVMVVNPTVPAKTVPQFIAYAKDNSGKVNMASAGVGSGVHMSGELFKMMAGVDMVHVPYRGDAQAGIT
jgi:tripartite-type tricarboxylate transporter receptor subunit TctC